MSKHPERFRRLLVLGGLSLLAALGTPSGAGAETSIAFSTLLPNSLGPNYEVRSVATDPSGAVYVTGGYAPLPRDTFPWDQFPFVMKLSPAGEVVYKCSRCWTTHWPGIERAAYPILGRWRKPATEDLKKVCEIGDLFYVF